MSIRKKFPFLPILAFSILLILGPLVYFRLIKPNLSSAAWFNDFWGYRTAITITNSGSAVTNQKVKLDIATDALYAAGKIQIACNDSRFTDANGNLLDYYLDSINGACNTTSTDYYVLLPTIYSGSTTIYHYYGNPSAVKGSAASQFSQTTFSQSATATSTEEQSKAPIAYWAFDSGYGTVAQDESSNNNDGTLGAGTSTPSWQTEDMCISGKCLKYDGNDFVSIGSTARDVMSISLWVRPATTSPTLIDLDGGTHYISATSNVVSATGFGTPTIYVNGRSNGALTINQWNHIEVTTATSFNATAIKLGQRSTNFLTGFMDEVKLFTYARSAAEIKADYNSGKAKAGTAKGTSVGGGGMNQAGAGGLSDGLIAWWKMDEASWNGSANEVIDSSGNSNHGVGVGTTKPTTGAGKFGNGGVFDGVDQSLSMGNVSIYNISGSLSLSAWIKPTNAANVGVIISKYGGGTGPYMFRVNNSDLQLFLNADGNFQSTSSDIIQSNIWQHVVAVYDSTKRNVSLYVNGALVPSTTSGTIPSSLNSSTDFFRIGQRANVHYFGGSIDEPRIYNRALSPAEVRNLYNWAPGPVVYYNFNEGVGSSAYDTSGNGKHSTFGAGTAAPTWKTGKYGKGLKFDGSNDLLNANTIVSSVASGDVTVSLWINPGINISSGVGQMTLFRLGDDPSTNDILFTISGGPTGGSDGKVYFSSAKESGYQSISSTQSSWTKGVWYYLTGVFSQTSGQDLYINGTKVSHGNYTTRGSTQSTHAIFGSASASLFPYNGSIDDVKMYNYARTQKQIVEDMNAGHPAGGSPVGSQVIKYSFDEGYGTTIKSSVSGIGGTAINGTLGAGASAPSWSNDGKFGKALSFGGDGDYAFTANTAMMAGNGQTYPTLAISAWVYPQTSAASKTILNKNQEFKLTTDANSKVNCSIGIGGTAWSTAAVASSALSLNTWSHVLCNYDGANIKVWTNGTNLANSTNVGSSAQIVSLSSTPLNIAKDATAVANYQGLIDEVKVYNYSLSQDEILTDFNSGSSLILGSLSSGSSNPSAPSAGSQEYCIPGDTTTTNCSPPVGRWDFNEGVGTSAYDSSGNGNNGVWVGGNTHWATGKIGKGAKFNGGGDVINVNSISSYIATGDISVSLWFNLTNNIGVGSSCLGMFHLGDAPSINDIWFSFGDYPATNDGKIHFHAYPTDLTSTQTSWNKNTWYHITGVYNQITGTDLYLNGIKIKHADAVARGTTVSAQARIGYWGSSYCKFNGKIDDLRIYSYARSPAQVAWDYNQGKPIAYYDFDKCQGTLLEDAIGPRMTGSTAFNGTITIGSLGTQSSAGTCALGVGSSTAWDNGTTGKYNSSLNFDGTDDLVSIGTAMTARSLSFWVKPSTSTTNIMQMSTAVGISANSGTINISGMSSPTTYVNGIPSSTLTAGVWQQITITTATAFPATAIKFGLKGSSYFSGQIDEAKIWNYALTSLQVKNEFNQSSAVRFGD